MRKSLANMLCLALFIAAWGTPWGRAAEKIAHPELDLEMLVPLMRKHQLPEPPGDAPLVLVHTHTWSVIGNQSDSRDPAAYTPGFLLEKKSGGQVVVMRGWRTMEVEVTKKSEPLIREFSFKQPKARLGGYTVLFSGSDCMVNAIQMAARGDKETAQALWRKCCDDMDKWPFPKTYDRKYQREELGREIYNHLLSAARDGSMEWPLVRDRMKVCLEDFPDLGGDAEQVGTPKAIYESLDLAVKAKPAKAGTVEDLLVRWSKNAGSTSIFGFWTDACDGEKDTSYDLPQQIMMKGYAAIPELERLSKDQRFTARRSAEIMSKYSHPMRLGELAEELIKEMCGALKSTEGLKDADGLKAAAFEYEGRRLEAVHETPLRMLAAKYPERLPALCAEFSRKAPDDLQPGYLAKAVAECALAKEVRVNTLVDFAKRGSLEHKRTVLQHLMTLDEAATVELLLPMIRTLPKDSSGAYWTCPEAAFTHVVMQTSDVRVWHDYLAAAKRSAIGLRMEMMNSMDYSYIGDKSKDLRLAYVAAFLDDTELRDEAKDEKKYDGPGAAFTFPKIEVRNFAAMKAASILEMDDEPDEHWSDERWQRLRGKVRARLLGMKLPSLAP